MFSVVPGVEINLFFIIFLSLFAGIISGFAGVGGGFIMTPVLIILGFPAEFAVGTSLLWVMGNSIIGALTHRSLGNIDVKLGIVMMLFTLSGVEAGIRVLNWARNLGLAGEAVLLTSICIQLIVGGYTLWESIRTKAKLDNLIKKYKEPPANIKTISFSSLVQRIKIPPILYFSKSNVMISLWMLLIIGVVTGLLSGLIGVGGGFVMVPSLIYLVGVPSFIAVGTDLYQIIFCAGFGTIRYTLDGNIVIFAAFIMVLSSSAGVYFGALVTRYLRGVSMRYVLASTILVSVLGSILKLICMFCKIDALWLQHTIIAVIFTGLALVLSIVAGLFFSAIRYRNGKHIPVWVKSLVKI